VSGELVLRTEALPSFQHSGLMCYRRILPFTGDNGLPLVAWVAGDARGCVAFQAGPAPIRLAYSTVDIGGVPWMAHDVGRHTPRPVADYDEEFGLQDSCIYLDSMCCYYDGSSLQAMELLKRAVAAGTEEAIWDELADYFRAWISDRDGEG
jgi:hypothetical protein